MTDILLLVLAVVGGVTALLVLRHASSRSVPGAHVWALAGFLTGGVAILAYLIRARRETEAPVAVSVQDRLPNSERPVSQSAPEPVIGNRPARRQRVSAQQLPPDPWGLEADRSVAPLISKRGLRGRQEPGSDLQERVAEDRS